MSTQEMIETLQRLSITQTIIIVALACVVVSMTIALFKLKNKVKDNKIALVNIRMALNDTINVVNQMNAKK